MQEIIIKKDYIKTFLISMLVIFCACFLALSFIFLQRRYIKDDTFSYSEEIEITPYNVTDLTGTSWVFNESIYIGDFDSDFVDTYSIYFESNLTIFNSITFFFTDDEFAPSFGIQYSIDNVYSNFGGWSHTNYKTIEITGGTDATNSTLYNWLYQNATLQQNQPIQLTTPILSYSIGVLSWVGDSNAEYYEIYLNNQLYDTTISTNYNITSLGNYYVIAIGDETTYLDSDASNIVNVSATALSSPTIIYQNFVISWLPINNADYYEIYIDSEYLATTTNTNYTFLDNGVYQVKAFSNSVFYSPSIFSNSLVINYQYAEVIFYAKDNITELLHIEQWLIGSSIYNFHNSFYSFDNLISLISIDSGLNSISNYNLYFYDSIFKNNIAFDIDYIISSDISLYYKVIDNAIFTENAYNTNDYIVTSSNNSTLFSNNGDNLISSIGLSTIDVTFDYFQLGSYQFTSKIIQNGLSIISDFSLGDNFSVYIDSFGNNFYFDTKVTQDSSNTYYENYLYNIDLKSNSFYLPLMNYNKFIIEENSNYYFIGYSNNITINYNDSQFLTNFKYNQNMNYYYCNYFGFTFKISNYDTNSNNYLLCYIFDTNNKFYKITYNYGLSSDVNYFDYLLINSANFKNYYYKNTHLGIRFVSNLAVNGLNTGYTTINECVSALESLSVKFEFGEPIIYYSDSAQQNDIATGGIIPTDSTGLYKTNFAWYDVSAYLYNFLIYLIFDMPILSNFTSIIFQIISFIYFIFNQIVTLFSGVKNNIYVISIIGFLVLKLILSFFKRD